MMARIGWTALCVTVSAIIAFLVVLQTTQKRGRLALSTVKVFSNGGHGSGVHTGSRYIVTAAHVVRGQKEVTVKSSTGSEALADVLWLNEAQDIALLRARELPDVDVSRLSCGNPSVGQHISAVGNPGPLEFITAYGRVSSGLGKNDRWADYYIAAMAVAPGMSGGPVFNERGNVVGIVVGVALTQIGWGASAVSLAYIAPASAVCNLLMRTA
jgi:serine protease Do